MISSKDICQKFDLTHNGEEVFLNNVSSLFNPRNKSLIFIKDKSSLSKELHSNLIDKKDIFLLLPKNCSDYKILHSHTFIENPKNIFFSIIEEFFTKKNNSEYISSSSKIDKKTKIGKNVFIDSNVSISGECSIGDNVRIGKNSLIIGPCSIGNNTSISSNVIIGEESISVRYENGKPFSNPQLGGVVIGDFCRIGFNSAIAKGTIDDTIVGNHVLTGEFNSIAHNSVIGDNTVLTVRTTINGSSKVGKNCWFGPHSTIMSYVNIGDNITLSANSVFYSSVSKQGTYIGNPAKLFKV
tara:strand:- start:4011 stop:4901 length:891 start_codon:yes stop_codon:yes gene_type:complete